MHLSLTLLAAALSTVTGVSAAKAASCTKNDALGHAVSTLSSEGTAGPFCTSYLPIKTKTITSTVRPSPKTKTVTTYTKTITKHAPVTTTITTTTTISTCSLPASQSGRASFSASASNPPHSGSPPPGSSFAKIKRASTSPSTVPTPSPLSSLSPKQKSQACECLAFPTPSSTVTVTRGKPTTTTITVSKVKIDRKKTTSTITNTATTTTDTCAAPTTCNNQGLQYAVFQNPEGPNGNDYANYDPTYMKAPRAGGDGISDVYYNATTTTIGGIYYQCNSGQNISVYGNPYSFPCTFFSLDHRGYLYAPLTGNYNFAVHQVDDIAFIWSGSNALAGWTRQNADLVVAYGQEGQGPGYGSKKYYLNKGEYLPIRIVFGQAQGIAAFSISVTDPKGRVLLDSGSQASPYVVQHSCNGAAPPFPYNFGFER